MFGCIHGFYSLPNLSTVSKEAEATSYKVEIRLVQKIKKLSVSGLEIVSVKARVNEIMRARDSY